MTWRQYNKRVKYSNESCKCVRGHIHDSRGEAKYCTELFYQLKAGLIQSYQIQRKYPLIINRKSYGYMRVDFEVITKEGKKEIREYKGMPTAAWRIKVKLFKAIYPDIPYIVIWHKSTKRYRV